MLPTELQTYYADRAAEYELVYQKPERQEAIASLRAQLRREFAGRTVLEAACGTGFWTQTLVEVAAAVTATDLSREVLDIARQKPLPIGVVTFAEADAFTLDGVPVSAFDAGFSGFWWSHIPKPRIAEFLAAFHCRLRPGARVLFADNIYVAGSNHPISRTDGDGNTYQQRTLASGTRYEVLKNFPARRELEEAVAPFGGDVRWVASGYFWSLSYTAK